PLEHFVRWTMRQGWRSLPNDLPDLKDRIERVLRDDPGNPYALYLFVPVLFQQKRFDEVLATLEQSEPYVALNLDTYILKGRCLQKLGDTAGAIKMLMEAYRTASPTYVELIGHLLYQWGERKKAVDLLAREIADYVDIEITTVRAVCLRNASPYQEIRPQRPIEGLVPSFINQHQPLTSQSGELTAPPIFFGIVHDCLAVTSCNLVRQHGTAIYDLAAHALGEIVSIKEHFQGLPFVCIRNNDRLLLRVPGGNPVDLPFGLMMFGGASHNYGHWFLEFLPRMLVFDSDVCDNDAPLMIDSGMPASHIEVLQLLNRKRRKLVKMPVDRVVRFKSLGMTPVPAFFPCDTVDRSVYDAVWPSDVFSDLRTRILEALGIDPKANGSAGGRRLFISRKAYTSKRVVAERNLVNESEIAEYLRKNGFETIYPETLSFAEQARLFNEADIVVGSCSSALSNGLFCKPGARMIGLIHDNPSFNFRGYASIMRAAGVEIRFLQGHSLPNLTRHPLHLDYIIELDGLVRGLSWAERGVKEDFAPSEQPISHLAERGTELDPARLARIAPLVDTAYYAAQVAGAGGTAVAESKLVEHYLTHGAGIGLSPNPLFAEGFYRAQLSGPLPLAMTGLEHYLGEGVAAGLDPSPLFSTTFYLSKYPAVADGGNNPLEHFLRCGMRRCLQSLPSDLPDLEDRIERVL
ncbi:DUF563 domain-containing protein, partial [Desulfovibrio aerotolerans]